MFYREAGDFRTSYASDQRLFPLRQDLYLFLAIMVGVWVIIPLFGNEFVLNSIMIPVMVLGLAALGLNILTGYAGQISLGTGAFMAVGAYAAFKLTLAFPDVNVIVWVLVSGFFSAAVGILFGLPSLKIKGFYLAIATLAAQFFFEWLFGRVAWFYNYNDSGAIETPKRELFGTLITAPNGDPLIRYFVVLAIVTLLTWIAINILRGKYGRMWMAIRDMDIAAELIGIRPLRAKLTAFAVSSFYCGVSGAMLVTFFFGITEVEVFNIDRSFSIVFMIIIGGLGSVLGSYLGAIFIVLLPIALRLALPAIFEPFGIHIEAAMLEHIQLIIFGGLIIIFLIVEPHGLARLWGIAREKLRLWPFPY